MIWLHDRFALDGRDPNTYTNILWCFGLHDRPWPEHPVFGKVRTMSLAGMERKTDVASYIHEIRLLEQTGSDPASHTIIIGMQVTVTGGTGFIGSHLVMRLRNAGHAVRILGRSPKKGMTRDTPVFLWNATEAEPPPESLLGVDAVIHLAGEPISQRWSPENRRRIRASRVEGTRLLVEAMARLERPPSVLVSASAIGYYGDRGEEVITEASAPGEGFLAEVCEAWETEAKRAADHGVRVVNMRNGMVLGAGGGALAQMLPPFRMFIGGKLGSGEQWMSWVHLDDVAGLIEYALQNPAVSGPVNATAPNPVRNKQFTQTLARTLHRPALFTVPEAGLKLLFGEMASILLDGQHVLPKAAESAGYVFQYPELGSSLKDLLG